MILSDRDIRAELDKGELQITPILCEDSQLQPASVDLRLDNAFLVADVRQKGSLEHPPVMQAVTAMELELRPGDFVLGSTIERVRIPPHLVGQVNGRSSLGRLGVTVHVTAGFIDPGFEGTITLEIANLGRNAVILRPGERVCQLVLQRLTSPAERPYGADRGSHYQGQSGPVRSGGDGGV